MRRVKRISPAICLSLSVSFISGCETVVYWEKLPPLTTPRVVRIIGDNEAILRGVKITQRLVDAARLPASTIFVMTLTHYRTNVNKSPLFFDYRARAFRCAPKGEQLHETLPPSSGCIVLPEDDLDRLSDDALAALIAHELASTQPLSVVMAPYWCGEHLLGTLGVIGPTRMDYSKIVPLVDYTATLVSRSLSAVVP